MARIKITGYLEVDDDQVDLGNPVGLTEEAFLDIAYDEYGTSPKVSDLEDIDTELD